MSTYAVGIITVVGLLVYCKVRGKKGDALLDQQVEGDIPSGQDYHAINP